MTEKKEERPGDAEALKTNSISNPSVSPGAVQVASLASCVDAYVKSLVFDGESITELYEQAVETVFEAVGDAGCAPSGFDLREYGQVTLVIIRRLLNDANRPEKDGGRALGFGRVKALPPEAAADIAVRTRIIRRIVAKNVDEDGTLTYYDDDHDSSSYGTYCKMTTGRLAEWGRQMAGLVDTKWLKEFEAQLRANAKGVTESTDDGIVFGINGILDYDKREILPFTPDVVRMNKFSANHSTAPYAVPTHEHVKTGATITPDSWVDDVADHDPEVALLIWQTFGMVLRPYHPWRTSIWVYDERGKNGKSTYLAVLQALVGDAASTECDLDALSGDKFGLADIEGKNLLVCGDSDPGEYIKKAKRFKQLVAHEPVRIEHKGKDGYRIRPFATIVAAMNDMAGFREKSTAITDRLTIIPFKARFNGRDDDPTLKDWLCSQEVLDYIAQKALMLMPHYDELSRPRVVEEMLHEFRLDNDSVYDFVCNYLDDMAGDWLFLPYGYLFIRYQVWLKETRPSASPGNQRDFTDSLVSYVDPARWYATKTSDPSDGKLYVRPWNAAHSTEWVLPYHDPKSRDPYATTYYSIRGRGLVRREVFDYCMANGVKPIDIAHSCESVLDALGLSGGGAADE